MSDEETTVVRLARRQLEAYNSADLEAFCACFSTDVCVLDEAGAVTMAGREAFREGYASLFSRFSDVRAEVMDRLALGRHVVEREQWWRTNRETREEEGGEVLVRYSEKDGLIALVEFLR